MATASADSMMPLVFLLEDDGSVGRALARLLSLGGLRVELFADSNKLLRQLQDDTESPCCLLMDVQVRGMVAFDFLRHLQVVKPGLPVIVVTSCENEDVQHLLCEAAVVAYLHKPVDELTLSGAITAVLQRERRSADN